MTKRIYIRGNVGDLRNAHIYDADTDKQLDDVAKFRLEADAAGVVQAWLVRLRNPDVMVDVVAGPVAARTGQTFYLVTLDADRRRTHCDTVHVAKAQSLTMMADGTLDFRGGQVVSMHDAVSDAEVQSSFDPRNVLEESAIRALLATLHRALIDPLITKVAGGAVFPPPAPNTTAFPPPSFPFSKPPKKVDPRPKCPECFDTGLTNGFMHPCSKGCTP